MQWLFDLDGVIWRGGQAIPGAADAVDRIRAAGHGVAFVTNNSGPTRSELVDRLADAGIQASGADLFTSAQAAASLLDAGTSATIVGDAGIVEALTEGGIEVVEPDAHPQVVVVGRSAVLDHDRLALVADALRGGARFIATNTDATFPTPTGLVPGAGATVAFLATAGGASAEVAGKPHRAVADLVRDRLGPIDVMVGDRADTDGLFAQAIGARFALVLSGVTKQQDLPVEPDPETVDADLAALADRVLHGP